MSEGLYRRLLTGEPLQWKRSMGGAWVCGQYRPCMDLLRDRRLVFSTGAGCNADTEEGRLRRILSEWLLFREGEEHRRLRRALHAGFTAEAVAAFGGRFIEAANQLVERLFAAQGGDFVRDVAYPAPSLAIASLLGVDAGRREALLAWTQQIADFLRAEPPSEDAAREARAALDASRALFRDLIERRRADPCDDPISRMPDLDPDALSLQCVQLAFAGHETVRNLLARGWPVLLDHPDQLDELRRGGERLLRGAVEELARFVSPARFVERFATEDFEVEGKRIGQGQAVLVCLGSANRDPRRFTDPDRFDIHRDEGPNLAFGAGVHACLGAGFGKLTAQAVIAGMARR